MQQDAKLAEFLRWLKEQEALAGKSEREWREGNGQCEQSVYRNGMWFAYHEAVQQFSASFGHPVL